MMIFLTVLKVIGITLLAVIGLGILILCMILFLPVRYRINALFDQNAKKYEGHVDVTWLLKFLHAEVWAEPGEGGRGIGYEVRVAGIRIIPGKEEQDTDDEDTDLPPDYDPVPDGTDLQETTLPAETGEKGTVSECPESESPEPEKDIVDIEKELYDDGYSEESGDEQEPQVKFTDKIRGFFRKTAEALRNLGYTIKRFCDKIKQILLDISYYKNLWNDAETQEVLAYVLDKTGFLWRRIKPRKWKLRLHFGLSDPMTTGEAFGTLCAVGPVFGRHLQVQPEFEDEVLEGDLCIAGHIQLFFPIVIGAKLYFNKKLKRVISRFKRGRRKDIQRQAA
ncbi:Protein of unknown function [Lachnospiraceae bacterium]|nr:Protein of unknown function [Lachnospiraceae bacterium]